MPTLPFSKRAWVRDQQGDDLVAEQMPVSDPWPTTRSVFSAGAHYDFNAEAPLEFADLLETANVTLHIGSRAYKVIDRERHDYLPHVVLRLRETRSGG